MARRSALGSDFKTQVGCAVYEKGKLIATGASTEKTHPMQFEYNKLRQFDRDGKNCADKAHAEMIALAKLKNMDVKMSDVTFYIVRLCRARPFGMARPCPACQAALRDAGVQDIRYTTNSGVAREWFDYKEA